MAALGFVGVGALRAHVHAAENHRNRQCHGVPAVYCLRLRVVARTDRVERNRNAAHGAEDTARTDVEDTHAIHAEDVPSAQHHPRSWTRELRVKVLSVLVAVGAVLLPGGLILPGKRASTASAATQISIVAKNDKKSSKKSSAPPSVPGKRTLDPKTENMLGYGAAGVAFSGFALRMFQLNQKEKRLENERIEAEIERLEKLKQEFLDVDEESDEEETSTEMMDSLRKRLGQVGGAEGTSEESESETEAELDERDMLKRMWDASGADSGDNSEDKKEPKNRK